MNDAIAEGEGTVALDIEPREGGAVARVVIDNPAKLNIMTPAMCEHFVTRMHEAATARDVRAIVLTGAGERAFIGGADISAMAEFDCASARTFITALHAVCASIREVEVPVIARIDGFCLGGGMEIAAACDMRAATERSLFGMPEVRVGIPSVIEAALLPGLIGWGKTCELLFTGATVKAPEARAMGYLQSLSPDVGELDGAVDRWLSGIIASGPRAVALQKQLMRRWEKSTMDQAIAAGIDSFVSAYETDEPNRMMHAFQQRQLARRPR
ncbi:enoyl-CoA hydratase [Acuticoccus sp. I52.16.1]|uniref:enoyl-CoA hydratase n=1 Tax=Acuticoccus sp. I52.16.1 TaxID=2928472 RepID=UPI001FD43F34|nr:enoyl-CoA hydratase [Acuticoccus sp. I52.16.1]UOM34580.1 enoyl-CoA hydratase [Acuticoccus sp. I52.16.1]